MSKSRKRKKKPPIPLPAQPSWLKTLRALLLVEAGFIAAILLYMRIADPFERGIDAWIATFVMILWNIIALFVAYAASRPSRDRARQVGWVAAGLLGGTAIMSYMANMAVGAGSSGSAIGMGSTAALGLVALPVYHWGLIALMLFIFTALGWSKR